MGNTKNKIKGEKSETHTVIPFISTRIKFQGITNEFVSLERILWVKKDMGNSHQTQHLCSNV